MGSGLLVFLMQAGFCMLEAGCVRSKNAVHVAVKNLFDICIVSVAFILLGHGIAYGDSVWGLFGVSGFFFSREVSALDSCFAFFNVMFCGTAATIVSGAVTERIRTKAYLFTTLVLSATVYPMVVHWVWATVDGAPVGWLARLGFIDFAGSTVVHSVGGWSALAIVLQLGPRRGRFRSDSDDVTLTTGSSLTLSTLGVFLLWFGWFGFNAGGAFFEASLIPQILMNTFVAPAAAGAVLLTWKCVWGTQIGMKPIVIGVIGGLVAVTAGCHVLDTPRAMAMGAMGGVVAVLAAKLMVRLRIDDPLDAIATHGVAGVVGTIGLVVLAPAGTFRLGFFQQLGVQALGCLAVFAFVMTTISLATFLWSRLARLRVTALEEEVGLNVCEHGARSEFHELLIRARYGDVSDHGAIESNDTEVVDEFSEYGVLRQAVNHMLETSRDRHARLEGVIEETRAGAVDMLLDLCEYRDNETASHLRRIQLFSVLLAMNLKQYTEEVDDEFVEDLRRASVLHDIGKVGIPDEVLLKPSRFTPEERAVMETHTVVGAEILQKARRRLGEDVTFIEMAADVARSHHERYDGSGYPDGIAGDDIPLAARIVAVADVFDALVSRRVYKSPVSALETRTIILSESGKHFDPEIVASFVAVFDRMIEIHRQFYDRDEADAPAPPVPLQEPEQPLLV